jgi:hypothetical protein
MKFNYKILAISILFTIILITLFLIMMGSKKADNELATSSNRKYVLKNQRIVSKKPVDKPRKIYKKSNEKYEEMKYVLYENPHFHSKYKKIFDVYNLKQLKDNFIWDNPREDGTDPTGGMVDYGYGMATDGEGNILKNINGDISWGEIHDNPTSKELISDYKGGIKINLSNLMFNNLVGAPRLMSRKLFRGGLFIFDVEHVPIGCGVWPAIWLNGFIGAKDQYHQNENGPTYKEDIQKLARTTLGTTELYSSHICKNKEDGVDGRKDDHLSKFAGKDIYPMEWPGGGEIDIVEQTNFSPTNLVSIHGGSNCQVTTSLEDTPFINDPIYGSDYNLLRSVCGGKSCKSDVFDDGTNPKHIPSCPERSVNDAGNSQINVPNGFGEKFNDKKGGVYAVQWIPKEKIYVWFYPNNLFPKEHLEKNKGPLSNNPDPDTWNVEEMSNVSNKYYRTLVASYILNDKNAIVEGCDLNFQGIIINITLGGGWGGSSMPKYCSVDNNSVWTDYIPKCYTSNPDTANNNESGAYDPETKCYDGGRSGEFRGIDSKALFYSEAYFKIRSIKVFQNNITDQQVW